MPSVSDYYYLGSLGVCRLLSPIGLRFQTRFVSGRFVTFILFGLCTDVCRWWWVVGGERRSH